MIIVRHQVHLGFRNKIIVYFSRTTEFLKLPNSGIIGLIDPSRRTQIDHTIRREYIRPFWIRNPGPNASGAGSLYDQLLQGFLRTCELYQLRKITVIGQLQNLEIDFTLFRTINQTAIPPAEFIQVKHMQSNQIRHDSRMPTIAIGKAMNRYQTVLKTDCDFFR
jgi:hypothetical protein